MYESPQSINDNKYIARVQTVVHLQRNKSFSDFKSGVTSFCIIIAEIDEASLLQLTGLAVLRGPWLIPLYCEITLWPRN